MTVWKGGSELSRAQPARRPETTINPRTERFVLVKLIRINVPLPSERTMGSEPEDALRRRARALRQLTLGAFGGDKGITGVGETVDHLVEVVFEAAGEIDAFHFKRQCRLLKEFFVMAQSVMVRR